MIPDYQSVMLPLLNLVSDGATHTVPDVTRRLGEEFALTTEDLNQLLPSGNQRVFSNRIGWALTYLKKAGLLESRGRAAFSITTVGREILASKPKVLNNKVLANYPSFLRFRSRSEDETSVVSTLAQVDVASESATPEDRIEDARKELDAKLIDDLFDRLQTISWQFFERLVLQLLIAMGYGGARKDAASHSGGSGDQGIDGLINEDALGLDRVYVQAKKWANPVGSPEMQAFVGALAAKNARKGVFFTTNKFTSDAEKFVKGVGAYSIALVNGRKMAELMLKYEVGTQPAATVTIKRIDSDFFAEVDG